MAAEQGNYDAQDRLADLHQHDFDKDDEKAAFWYNKAQQGFRYAQYYLGCMYEEGRSLEQSDKQAVLWWHKAANQGIAGAQISLGWMFQTGQGLEQDNEQALFWYRKAAEQGSSCIQDYLA